MLNVQWYILFYKIINVKVFIFLHILIFVVSALKNSNWDISFFFTTFLSVIFNCNEMKKMFRIPKCVEQNWVSFPRRWCHWLRRPRRRRGWDRIGRLRRRALSARSRSCRFLRRFLWSPPNIKVKNLVLSCCISCERVLGSAFSFSSLKKMDINKGISLWKGRRGTQY